MSKIQYGSLPLQVCAGKTYYIGDIHNEGDKLISLLDQIQDNFTWDDRIVFLGDLVDRGLFAALTIDELVRLNRHYPGQIFFVRGNHDWMLQHYLMTGRQDWMQYLAVTLDDFQRQWGLPDILPNTIMQALIAHGFDEIATKFLPYYETEDVIATHAPLDFATVYMYGGMQCKDYIEEYNDHLADPNAVPKFRFLLDRMQDELLWQFTSPENYEIIGIDKFHICGHQPGNGKHARVFKHRAFIDTGCGKGNRPCTSLLYPGKSLLQSKI